MSPFDLGLLDGAFITLGIEALIHMIVGAIRRARDSKPEPTR